MTVETKPALVIRIHAGPRLRFACPVCGIESAAAVGPAIFLEGDERPVCSRCAERHGPELVELLRRGQAVGELIAKLGR